MKLTENEIIYVLSEILKEDADIKKLYEVNNNVTNPGTLDAEKHRYYNSYQDSNDSQGKNVNTRLKKNFTRNTVVNTAKSLGKGVGTAFLAAAAGAALNSGFGDFISSAGAIGAILGVVGNCANSLIRQNRVLKMKMPKSERSALDYGRYAAAERAYLQEQCKIIQANLNNAMRAYNMWIDEEIKNGNNNIDQNKINWEIIKSGANGGMQILKNFQNQEIGNVEVNYGTDFNDKYVKESIIKENMNHEIVNSVNVYLATFEQNSQQDNLSVVFYIAKLYNAVYGMWWQWGHYIGKLCAKYPKTLNWKKIIDSNRKFSNGEIIAHYAKMILPKEWAKFIPDGKTPEEKNEFDKSIKYKFNFQTINPSWTNYNISNTKFAQTYSLFKCLDNNLFYAIKNLNNIAQDEYYTVWFSENDIKQKIKDDNNNTVFVLNSNIKIVKQ